MQDAIKRMQQIRGIGTVLATRLVEAGIDTIERFAAASETELAAVRGLPAGSIPALKEQARARLNREPEGEEASLTQMIDDTERLREGMATLVIKLRDRHADSDDGKDRRNLRKEITRVLATLERVEASLAEQLRRLGKKLAKADARLTSVPEDDLAALTKGLRHTRKAIGKIVRS